MLRAWGNPRGNETLGMLVPAGVRVLAPEGWGVIINFSEDGYVKDDDFDEFNGGHRYAGFIPGTDKVAEYGIAALIAGGLAAKAGLFKGFVAAAAFLRKLFRRKPADAAAKP